MILIVVYQITVKGQKYAKTSELFFFRWFLSSLHSDSVNNTWFAGEVSTTVIYLCLRLTLIGFFSSSSYCCRSLKLSYCSWIDSHNKRKRSANTLIDFNEKKYRVRENYDETEVIKYYYSRVCTWLNLQE